MENCAICLLDLDPTAQERYEIQRSELWVLQDQTSYQRMLGFQPKPCMLTIINLKSHRSISIPFA